MSFNSDSSDKFGIYLLKNGKRGLIRALFSRIGLIIVLLALQIGLLVAIYYWFEQKFQYFYIFTLIFSLAMVLWLLNSDAEGNNMNKSEVIDKENNFKYTNVK